MDQANGDDSKGLFLMSNTVPIEARKVMYPGWQQVCLDPFLNFRKIVGEVFSSKEFFPYDQPKPLEDGTIPNRIASVLKDVDDVYKRVLALFEGALQKAVDQSAANVKDQANENLNDDSTTNSGPIAAVRPGHLRVRPRTRSARPLKSATVGVPEASGSNKRRTRESENEESPIKQKRACPPARVPGPSAFPQLAVDKDD